MRRIIFFLLILTAIVAVIGFYRGWFDFSTSRGEETIHYEVTVDKEKVREDVEQAREGVENLGERAKKAVEKPREP